MAANTNQVSLTQLVNPLDPNSVATAYQIQRQQAYAKALQDQAFQPMDQGKMVGNWFVAPPKSAHIAKLVEMLLSGYANKTADENAAAQVKSNVESIGRAVDPDAPTQAVPQPQAATAALSIGGASGAQAPAAAIDPTTAEAPLQPGQIGAATNRVGPTPQSAAIMDTMTTPAPSSTGSSLNPLKLNKDLAVRLLMADPTKYYERQADAFKPADIIGRLRAAGINPDSPEGRAYALQNIKKENYIAPVNAREGSTLLDPVTHLPIFNAPKDGGYLTFDAQGRPTANIVPGVADVIANTEAARVRGRNTQTPAPKELLRTNPDGTVQPSTVAQVVDQANPPNASLPNNGGFPAGTRIPAQADTGTLKRGQNDRLSVYQDELAGIQSRPDSDPRKAGDLAAIQREIKALGGPASGSASPAAPVTGLGAPYGAAEGANLAQKELSTKWSAQQQAHQGAQTSSSYLQNIAKLADKAATGRFADRLDFINSILSSVGSDKATSAVTANDLMNKYQSQIVQQLGGGAAGTDAFRAIIGAGTPGETMNVPAIKEAVANLVGKNDMIKARTNLLSPHANLRDPVAYGQKETIFDQNADPRIWQWKNMQDARAKAAFAASILKSDPNFPAKIKALEQIGAF